MKFIQSNIKKAKKYLDNNHCVAVPTETVYGLAANAYSNSAVKKIFSLKKRPLNNPLIVHYYSIQRLKEDCDINDILMKSYPWQEADTNRLDKINVVKFWRLLTGHKKMDVDYWLTRIENKLY